MSDQKRNSNKNNGGNRSKGTNPSSPIIDSDDDDDLFMSAWGNEQIPPLPPASTNLTPPAKRQSKASSNQSSRSRADHHSGSGSISNGILSNPGPSLFSRLHSSRRTNHSFPTRNNKCDSYVKKFQKLRGMFPKVSISKIRAYLDFYLTDANCVEIVSNILLEDQERKRNKAIALLGGSNAGQDIICVKGSTVSGFSSGAADAGGASLPVAFGVSANGNPLVTGAVSPRKRSKSSNSAIGNTSSSTVSASITSQASPSKRSRSSSNVGYHSLPPAVSPCKRSKSSSSSSSTPPTPLIPDVGIQIRRGKNKLVQSAMKRCTDRSAAKIDIAAPYMVRQDQQSPRSITSSSSCTTPSKTNTAGQSRGIPRHGVHVHVGWASDNNKASYTPRTCTSTSVTGSQVSVQPKSSGNPSSGTSPRTVAQSRMSSNNGVALASIPQMSVISRNPICTSTSNAATSASTLVALQPQSSSSSATSPSRTAAHSTAFPGRNIHVGCRSVAQTSLTSRTPYTVVAGSNTSPTASSNTVAKSGASSGNIHVGQRAISKLHDIYNCASTGSPISVQPGSSASTMSTNNAAHTRASSMNSDVGQMRTKGMLSKLQDVFSVSFVPVQPVLNASSTTSSVSVAQSGASSSCQYSVVAKGSTPQTSFIPTPNVRHVSFQPGSNSNSVSSSKSFAHKGNMVLQVKITGKSGVVNNSAFLQAPEIRPSGTSVSNPTPCGCSVYDVSGTAAVGVKKEGCASSNSDRACGSSAPGVDNGFLPNTSTPCTIAATATEGFNHANVMSKPPKVTWFWEDSGGDLVAFSKLENSVLEEEFKSNPSNRAKTVSFRGSPHQCTVDFVTHQMWDHRGVNMGMVRIVEDQSHGSPTTGQLSSGKKLGFQTPLNIPEAWQAPTKKAELIIVRPGSAEYVRVENKLRRSIPEASITRIDRVQNQWLFRKYSVQIGLTTEKNGQEKVNELELFHGTGRTDPKEIWSGEFGFDMRFSAEGMWGRGVYFAVEAAYCHDNHFAHVVPQDTSTRQVFLAQVLTGDSVTLGDDRSIKTPPVNPKTGYMYDSINGITKGHKIYILYKLEQAYPAYLITYQMTRRRR